MEVEKLKEMMKTEIWEKVFIDFLEQNDAREAYFREIRDGEWVNGFSELKKKFGPENWLSQAFIWDNAPHDPEIPTTDEENFQYWENLNDRWLFVVESIELLKKHAVINELPKGDPEYQKGKKIDSTPTDESERGKSDE
jgi:hypothetical protein